MSLTSISPCYALPKSTKTFAIRTFFFEKWLLAHVLRDP